MLASGPLCRARPALLSLLRAITSSPGSNSASRSSSRHRQLPSWCPRQYLAPPTARATAGQPYGTAAAMAAAELPTRAKDVLEYWFGEGWEAADPDDSRPQKSKIWYSGAPEVDADIIARFAPDCESLLEGKCDSWGQAGPLGSLAGILLADQMFRNAFRGTAKMYAADGRALAWTKGLLCGRPLSLEADKWHTAAIRRGLEEETGADRQLKPIQRVFVYMPLMHSEELADQEECISRFEGLHQDCEASGLNNMGKMAQETVRYAKAHRDVVAQWGRFPHRNTILGRQNTPEEAAGIAAGTIPKW